MRALCAVLTRPQGQNATLAALLQARGCGTVELPALEITPLAFDPPDLSAFDLVMFVSGNAVRSFLDRCAAFADWRWPAGVAAAVVGAGSARALRAHPAFPASAPLLRPDDQSSADSEALWEVLRLQPALHRILIVRGGGGGAGRGRDWLGSRLEQAGRSVVRFGAYERGARAWNEADFQRLKVCSSKAKTVAWLFSSRESVDAIFAQLKQNGLHFCLSSSHLVLTHPRIRDHLVDLMLRDSTVNAASLLLQVCKPDDQSIVDAIESLL